MLQMEGMELMGVTLPVPVEMEGTVEAVALAMEEMGEAAAMVGLVVATVEMAEIVNEKDVFYKNFNFYSNSFVAYYFDY
jgi:microcompartment protein CcmL/EutN